MALSVAGAALGGSLASGLMQMGGQIGSTLIQAKYNEREAARQRKFEERMSNTAIQRQIADAQKAGLSPSLFIGGQNASTPMGATANIQRPDIDMSSSVNALMKYIRQDRALDLKERQLNELTKLNERKLDTYENTNFVPKSFDTKDLKFAKVDLDKVKLY